MFTALWNFGRRLLSVDRQLAGLNKTCGNLDSKIVNLSRDLGKDAQALAAARSEIPGILAWLQELEDVIKALAPPQSSGRSTAATHIRADR